MARLEELERKFEENPRRYFAPLANEYRKAGDARRAAELCRSQLPEVPGHISGHIVLGQALYDARDFAGARAALESALALDPENIVALRYLGDIASDMGDAAEAERWYARTLEADPYNEAATNALQLLRAAPAPAPEPERASVPSEMRQVTEETPQPDTEEPDTEEPDTDSRAVGYEPTSYAEPEPSKSVEPEPAESAEPKPLESVEPEPSESVEPESAESVEPSQPVEVSPPADIADIPADAPTEPGAEHSNEVPEGHEPLLAAAAEFESAAPGVLTVTGEFAGDLSVSTTSELTEVTDDEPSEERFDVAAHALPEPVSSEPVTPEPVSSESVSSEPVTLEPVTLEPVTLELVTPEPATPEEAIQAEERVLESAAPFVTETMADLYLEQGYPHEALELLLQLSEQRPQDEDLRAKIEHIESVIVARRDAAVAAARAERAETVEAVETVETVETVNAVETVEAVETVVSAEGGEDAEIPDPPAAPFDAAVAEVDSSAFATSEPGSEEPISVRELFARMDGARPRAAGSVTPRPLSRRRSDFVSMPVAEAIASDAADDPFAFPNPPAAAPAPRTSGPQPTFNPSTADPDDFNAWLRGLRGP